MAKPLVPDDRWEREEWPALCCAPPPVAALPEAGHNTEESVNHVSEHVSPLTPV
jgi:hypothetical protein